MKATLYSIHGSGFSFAPIDDLQFCGSPLLLSLFAFNVGIEFGQLLVLRLAVQDLTLLFRRHTLRRNHPFCAVSPHGMALDAGSGGEAPAGRVADPSGATVVTLSRWLLLLLLVGGAVWVLARQAGRRAAVQEPVAEKDLA